MLLIKQEVKMEIMHQLDFYPAKLYAISKMTEYA